MQCEKAFKRWSGPDATAEWLREPTRAELVADLADFRRQRPVLPANVKTPSFTKSFLDSMWSPEAEGRSLIKTTSFCGFSAGLRRPNHLAAVGGILVSSGFAAIFAEFELPGLRHQARFAGKSPSYASLKSYHPTSVHRRGIGAESSGIFPPDIGFRRRTCQRRHF